MNGPGRASIALMISLAVAVPGGFTAAAEKNTGADKDKSERFYDEGSRRMDDGEWEAAIKSFEKVIDLGGRQSDAACYWKAYALRKLTRLPEALASIEELRKLNPRSAWIDDARALELEIRNAKGTRSSPETENDEEMKLVAINALGNVDPERAVPMLEKLIRSGSSTRLREQALFVLVQIGSSRARDLLYEIARGRSHPELQRKAIEYLGMFNVQDARPLLKEILNSSPDASVRRAVLNAYMTSGDTESLYAIAKSERDDDVRRDAINLLGAQGATEELMELYKTETSTDVRAKILESLGICGSTNELIGIARTERDPRLRRAAIHGIAIGSGPSSTPALMSIYTSDKDPEVRRAVLDAFMIQANDTALIKVARTETNPELKRRAVEYLGSMGSKQATEFLLQILND